MMKVIESPQALIEWRKGLTGKTVGFVPTMGALHEGHATLLRRCRKDNDVVVLSIFVNPTQFNDANDFAKYPKTWEADLEMAKREGVDVVFAPSKDLMYPDGYKYRMTEDMFSKTLEGAHRPGHFDGVLTVVLKLFLLVQPLKAYFGEKDYQQLCLIRGMVEALFLTLTIVPVATVRESDGLAMSSRNVRLSPTEREKAPLLYKTLKSAKTSDEASQALSKAGFRVDYVTDQNGRRLAATYLGEVRLIDNVEI